MAEPSINWAGATGLPPHLWLASKSPRRLELIRTLGLEATVFLAQQGDAAEAMETPLESEPPLDYVERVTRLKLSQVLRALQSMGKSGPVLASDTTVARGQQILGKPQTAQEARDMLGALSDQTHHVHTCVAVAWLPEPAQKANAALQAPSRVQLNQPLPEPLVRVQTSEVFFGHIPAAFVEAYIQSGEPFDKAGGYGIQGVVAQYITRINGSHSGIMGLPLCETAKLLRELTDPKRCA